jgi:hypothetical protein
MQATTIIFNRTGHVLTEAGRREAHAAVEQARTKNANVTATLATMRSGRVTVVAAPSGVITLH